MILRVFGYCILLAGFLLTGIYNFQILTSEANSSTSQEVMFEGYYSIKSGGVPAGYIIQRYIFDKKKKEFHLTYYIRTGEIAGDITESLKSVSNDKFEPLRYEYTSRVKDQFKTLDATFKNGIMILKRNESQNLANEGQGSLEISVPKDTILSNFLNYYLLSKGLKVGSKIPYSGITEEIGEIQRGEIEVKEETSYKNLPVFKISNQYGKNQYISFMTKTGEVLQTRFSAQSIETELVAVPSEATKSFSFDTAALQVLFGSIPTGRQNALYKAKESVENSKNSLPSKKEASEDVKSPPSEKSNSVNKEE